MQPTNPGLLEQMKERSTDSVWEEFYQTYWSVILSFARKQGLNEMAAQDVLQETMVALFNILPRFRYNPEEGRFRNFLLTIVYRKALSAKRRETSHPEVPYDTVDGKKCWSPSEAIVEESNPSPAEHIERQWRESLQEEALRRVRDKPSVRGRTWQVFQAYVLDGSAAVLVARQFGINENVVYQIKNRVLKQLRNEVRKMVEESNA